ncbi:hypothetical protein Tco_0215734 [Tanacetum coccineum]
MRGNFISQGMSTNKRRKFFRDVKLFLDDPIFYSYLLRIKHRRCVHGQEALEILKACHEGPTEGHHSANLTARKTVELSQPDGPNFKVNGHRVKHYFGGDLPPKEVQDLHTLPKDE